MTYPSFSYTESITGTVNLTTEGVTDWWHVFDYLSANDRHKSGGGSVITMSGIGITRQQFYESTSYQLIFSYSNGTTPNVSGTDQRAMYEPALNHVTDTGKGWRCVVPAGIAPQRLKFYVGANSNPSIKITATLSDASYTFTDLHPGRGGLSGVITVDFNANTNGQTLTVDFVLEGSFDGTLAMAAVTLAPLLVVGIPKGVKNWFTRSGSLRSPVITPAAPPASPPIQTSTPFGINIPPPDYFTTVELFRDTVRMSGGWPGGVTVDSQGWPNQDLTGFIPQWMPNGIAGDVMNCEFNGYAASITASGAGYLVQNVNGTAYDPAVAYNSGTNKTTFKIVLPATGREQNNAYNFTGTKKTGGAGGTQAGLTNLRMLRPGESLASNATFTTKAITAYSAFSELRLMDFFKMNFSPIASWAGRPTLESCRTSLHYDLVTGQQLGIYGLPFEVGIELGNACNRNIWIPIPVLLSALDRTSLFSLVDSTLNSGLICTYEDSNEPWNNAFSQTFWLRDQCADELSGFYSDTGMSMISSMSRSGSTVTVIFTGNHNIGTNPGDAAARWAHNIDGFTGQLTMTRVNATTATFPKSGAAGAVSFNNDTDWFFTFNLSNNYLVSAVRSGTTVRLVFSKAHGWGSNGSTRQCWINDLPRNFGTGVYTATVVSSNVVTIAGYSVSSGSVPDGEMDPDSSFTVISPTALTGVGSNDLTYDNFTGLYTLTQRFIARRTMEMSQACRAQFAPTAVIGNRFRFVFAPQASSGDNYEGPMAYAAQHDPSHPPGYHIWAIAGGIYHFLWTTPGDSNTNIASDSGTHIVSDYVNAAAGNATNSKIFYGYHKAMAVATKYGLRFRAYEWGYDVFGDAGSTNNVLKGQAMFDAGMLTPTANSFNDFYRDGGELICYFHGGTQRSTDSAKFGCWALYEQLGTETPRSQAILNVTPSPAAVSRNAIPGLIDARMIDGFYGSPSGNFPDGTVSQNRWNYTFSSLYTAPIKLIAYYTCIDTFPRTMTFTWNGVAVGGTQNIQFTGLSHATTLTDPVAAFAEFTLTPKLGINNLVLIGANNPNANVRIVSIKTFF